MRDLFRYVKENVDTKRIIDLKSCKIQLDNMRLGSQIAYFRKKKNLTQRQLAKKINVCTDSIKKYENQEIILINIDVLKKIFEVLNMNDKVILNDYFKFVLNNPSEILKDFLNINNMKGVDLARLMNKNSHEVHKWIRGNTVMSESNFNLLMPIMKEKNYSY